MESATFRNWTNRDFTYPWAKVPYTFKAGETSLLDDFAKTDRPALAFHFAKHLAVRELHSEKLQANDPKFEEYVNRALSRESAPVVEPEPTVKEPMVSEVKPKKKPNAPVA